MEESIFSVDNEQYFSDTIAAIISLWIDLEFLL